MRTGEHELSLRWSDLPASQSPPSGAAASKARQVALVGPLGYHTGSQPHLRPPEPGHQGAGLNAIHIIGPGHGGPAAVANAYLEDTYT